MSVKNVPPYAAHFDGNQVPSLMGVEGTLGTSDTGGTARNIPVGANPATGALYVQDLAGAAGTTTVQMVSGTLNVGTVTATLALNTGTLTTIAAGTQNTLGTVGVVNAIAAGTQNTLGTVGVVNNLVTGTIAAVSSVAEVVKGTTTLVTRTGNVGTLELGSVVVTSLPSSGTLLNLASGTLASVASVGEVVKGTTTLVSTVTTLSNLTTGSIVVTSGTLGSVGAVAQVHNAGTIQAGTVQINPTTIPQMLTHGTLGTAGGSFFATISAASGAGTKHYVSGLQVVGQAGTADVRILAGTVINGTGVLAAGIVTPGGGFARDFNKDFNTGTGSELTYHFVGAGSAYIVVNYWKGA